MWSQIFLLLTCIAGSYYIFLRSAEFQHFRYMSVTILLSLFLSIAAELFISGSTVVLLSAGFQILATLSVLVVLLLIVHYQKPEHLQNSVLYSYIPLLIMPVLLFIINADSLLQFILIILQGAGLFVALLIAYLYAGNMKRSFVLFTGVVALLAGYTLHWFADVDQQLLETIVNLCIGTGICGVSYSLPELIKTNYTIKV